MLMIQLDKVVFAGTLLGMSNSGDAIKSINYSWSSLGESSITLDEYINAFSEICATITAYKNLINKDINSISSIATEIDALDNKLVNIWKNR